MTRPAYDREGQQAELTQRWWVQSPPLPVRLVFFIFCLIGIHPSECYNARHCHLEFCFRNQVGKRMVSTRALQMFPENPINTTWLCRLIRVSTAPHSVAPAYLTYSRKQLTGFTRSQLLQHLYSSTVDSSLWNFRRSCDKNYVKQLLFMFPSSLR